MGSARSKRRRRLGDRRAENVLLDDVYRTVQDADPNEQDVILLGDFNLPPEDSGMDEVDDLLDQCSRA